MTSDVFWAVLTYLPTLIRCFYYISLFTVLCISVCPRPKRLETRVIIKISTHPCYPRTFDYFSWDKAKKKIFFKKKIPKWPTQKNLILPNGQFSIFFAKLNGWVLGLVELIDARGIDLAQPSGCEAVRHKLKN